MYYTKSLLVLCCFAAFYVQSNDAAIQMPKFFQNILTNTVFYPFKSKFNTMASNIRGSLDNGISSLKTLLPMVANVQQNMLGTSKSMANSTFWDFFSMFYNSSSGPITLFKNLTTAMIASGGNYTNYFVVSGQNFSNCLNISQINSFRQAIIQNVTNCVQTEGNNTVALIQKQISSLLNMSANGLDVSAAFAKCFMTPLNMTKCISNVVTNITSYVTNLPQNITNLLTNDINTITKMGFNMTLCGTNMSLRVIQNVASTGISHMGCIYRLVAGQFNNATSSSSNSSTSSSSGSTSTTVSSSGSASVNGTSSTNSTTSANATVSAPA